MKVKIDDLAATVELELNQYGEDVREGIAAIVKRVSAKCVRRLQQRSPKRTGRYAKSWTKQESKPPAQPSAIIYNREYGWLVHLLENGHAKAGGGRVEGVPHVGPAAEEAERELVADAENLLREV